MTLPVFPKHRFDLGFIQAAGQNQCRAASGQRNGAWLPKTRRWGPNRRTSVAEPFGRLVHCVDVEQHVGQRRSLFFEPDRVFRSEVVQHERGLRCRLQQCEDLPSGHCGRRESWALEALLLHKGCDEERPFCLTDFPGRFDRLGTVQAVPVVGGGQTETGESQPSTTLLEDRGARPAGPG